MELSREKKAELAIASLMDSCEILAEMSGGVKHFAGYDAYFVPETFWYHRVRLLPAEAGDLAGTVEEIAAGAKAGALPPILCWLDCEHPDGAVMPLLERAGYGPITVQRAMYLSLEGHQRGETHAAVEHMPPELAARWAHMTATAFGKPPETGGIKKLAGDPDCDFLMCRDGEEIVAGMLLICRNGNGGVHEVGTLPAYRRRGLADGMMRHALDLAAARGCSCVTLQASEMGELVYTRLGMEAVGNVHTWILK